MDLAWLELTLYSMNDSWFWKWVFGEMALGLYHSYRLTLGSLAMSYGWTQDLGLTSSWTVQW